MTFHSDSHLQRLNTKSFLGRKCTVWREITVIRKETFEGQELFKKRKEEMEEA